MRLILRARGYDRPEGLFSLRVSPVRGRPDYCLDPSKAGQPLPFRLKGGRDLPSFNLELSPEFNQPLGPGQGLVRTKGPL